MDRWNFNYPAFHDAAEQLLDAGYLVLNPADAEDDNPTPGQPQAWEWYMRRALRQVTQADGIALLPLWERSRGAHLEVTVARELDIPRHSVGYWIAYRDEIRAEVAS
ncbi:DUF4406 domain-containing protein [Ornithinimicrobium sufpigmenti]|uniref:DUF4406 domain-containing protein n=1 Tax=Ornithinimicrobium sufpigmenti TaxID=2508882 RepID=UPI0015E1A918|nr:MULTISPECIES: DUF4406 domain-containing protein [unclassified Ornithinimicrobium]